MFSLGEGSTYVLVIQVRDLSITMLGLGPDDLSRYVVPLGPHRVRSNSTGKINNFHVTKRMSYFSKK